jgi:hypothetical protein
MCVCDICTTLTYIFSRYAPCLICFRVAATERLLGGEPSMPGICLKVCCCPCCTQYMYVRAVNKAVEEGLIKKKGGAPEATEMSI